MGTPIIWVLMLLLCASSAVKKPPRVSTAEVQAPSSIVLFQTVTGAGTQAKGSSGAAVSAQLCVLWQCNSRFLSSGKHFGRLTSTRSLGCTYRALLCQCFSKIPHLSVVTRCHLPSLCVFILSICLSSSTTSSS